MRRLSVPKASHKLPASTLQYKAHPLLYLLRLESPFVCFPAIADEMLFLCLDKQDGEDCTNLAAGPSIAVECRDLFLGSGSSSDADASANAFRSLYLAEAGPSTRLGRPPSPRSPWRLAGEVCLGQFLFGSSSLAACGRRQCMIRTPFLNIRGRVFRVNLVQCCAWH